MRSRFRKVLQAMVGRSQRISYLRAARAARIAESSEHELLLLSKLVKGRPFVDVGAHRGVYSIVAARAGALSLTAIEPNPDSAARLRFVLGGRARIVAAAASDVMGTAQFSVPIVAGSKRATRGSLAPDSDDSFSVQTTTLDSLPVPFGSIIKVDVEGHELAVLRGTARSIEQQRVAAFILEVESRNGDDMLLRVREMLNGFSGFGIGRSGLLPILQHSVDHFQSAGDRALVELGEPRPARYMNNFLFISSRESELLDFASRHTTYDLAE